VPIANPAKGLVGLNGRARNDDESRRDSK
jgi:hypothetical protein